ncbi:HtaA domain-containing protein [Streptomyces sp. NPDC006208]|uniref:HtaA domain-containing protein n=1 Tax=Streptomyces sp. NPDC006208 TaxID=3156734 RepID=UPI0033A365DF
MAEDGVVKLAGVPAKLTADGVKAFGNMYPVGEQLDALTLAVSLDEDQGLPPATGGTDGGTSGGASAGGGAGTAGGSVGGTSAGGSLATTGSGVPAGALLAACAGIVAAGAGVVAAVRRREPLRP